VTSCSDVTIATRPARPRAGTGAHDRVVQGWPIAAPEKKRLVAIQAAKIVRFIDLSSVPSPRSPCLAGKQNCGREGGGARCPR